MLLAVGCESMRTANRDFQTRNYQARISGIEKAYVCGDITKIERQNLKNEAFKIRFGRDGD